MLWTPAHSFWGLSKNRDVVDETYVVKLIAVIGVLTAVILVLADLQTMTDPLILPSRREHPQQSVDKDIEQLRGRDASLRYTCIKRDCCTFCVVWSQTDCCTVVNLLQYLWQYVTSNQMESAYTTDVRRISTITHTGLLLITHTDNPSCPVYTLCLPVFPKQNFKDVSASKDFLPILRHVHTATFCVRAGPGQVRQTYLSLPISCHAWTWCLAAISACFCMMMYYVCLLGLCHQVRWSVTYCLSPGCNSCFKVFQKCIARRGSPSQSWQALHWLGGHLGPWAHGTGPEA